MLIGMSMQLSQSAECGRFRKFIYQNTVCGWGVGERLERVYVYRPASVW